MITLCGNMYLLHKEGKWIGLNLVRWLYLFTLLLSIYSVRTLNQNKEKDRKVTVSLPEKEGCKRI